MHFKTIKQSLCESQKMFCNHPALHLIEGLKLCYFTPSYKYFLVVCILFSWKKMHYSLSCYLLRWRAQSSGCCRERAGHYSFFLQHRNNTATQQKDKLMCNEWWCPFSGGWVKAWLPDFALKANKSQKQRELVLQYLLWWKSSVGVDGCQM